VIENSLAVEANIAVSARVGLSSSAQSGNKR
jgi:hypothetical protein